MMQNETYIRLNEVILLAFISIASTAATLITPALPQIQNFYQLTKSDISFIISIFLFGYVLAQLLYGPLANAVGRISALRIGLIINLIGICISLISIPMHSYPLMLLGRFISALGTSAGLVCTFIIINENYTAGQAKYLLSYTIVSFTLGIYLGAFLGGVSTYYFGWHSIFFLLLFHGVVMLIATYRISSHSLPIGKKAFHIYNIVKNYAIALQNRELFIFSLILALPTVIAYLYAAQAPLIAEAKPMNLTAKGYGMWNMLNAIGMLSGGIVSAKLLKRFTGIQVISVGFIFTCIAIFCLFLVKIYLPASAFYFFTATTVLFFSSGLIYPSAAFYASTALECKASGSSAMNFINMSTGVLVVSIFGYFPLDHFYTFIVGLSIYTVTAIFLLISQNLYQNSPVYSEIPQRE